jgi:hypothetical protein
MFPELTASQLAALRAYARQHGRANWKNYMSADWRHGRLGAELQSLCVSHGPRWLATFQLPED